MPIIARYTPPAVHAGLALLAVLPAAEDAMAKAYLAACTPMVPVESGDLRDSGRTQPDGALGTAITWGSDTPTENGNITNAYVVKQHEDMDLNHPNGGESKWAEKGAHKSREEIMAAAHAVIAAVL